MEIMGISKTIIVVIFGKDSKVISNIVLIKIWMKKRIQRVSVVKMMIMMTFFINDHIYL
jgi:hypothetical protein